MEIRVQRARLGRRIVFLFGFMVICHQVFAGGAPESEPARDYEAELAELNAEIDRLQTEQETDAASLSNLQTELDAARANATAAEQASAERIETLEQQNATLQQQKASLEQRLRTLEALLRELSFAASLGAQGQRTPESQTTDLPGVNPEIIAEVNAALLNSLPAYESVESVLPYQIPGRLSRAFIPGSNVFAEDSADRTQRFLYDRRANYSNPTRVYAEVRTNLPQGGVELRLYFQAISNRNAGDLDLQSVELSTSAGRILLEQPDQRIRLQDAERKLERLGYYIGSPDTRRVLEYLTQAEDPSIVFVGQNQRIRVSLTEIEVGALVEMLQTYRDLGGKLP